MDWEECKIGIITKWLQVTVCSNEKVLEIYIVDDYNIVNVINITEFYT